MEKDVTMTSGPADYITLDDVTRSFITANADAFDNGIYRPRAGTVKRFVTGVADAFKENLKLKDSLMIFGGQGAMMVGGVFGEDSSLSSWGREIVRAGSRQIAAIDAENAKNSDLTDYEKDTFAYKLGSGFSSVFQMLLLAYATGGAGSIGGLSKGGVQVAQKVAGVGLATVQEISSETQEGIQNYRQKTGDNDLKNYTTKEARKEFLSTAGYGVVSGALETIELSKVMPFLKEGKKVIPNFWKGAIAEGTTEMLQELANIGFDWADGTIDFSKMPERLYGMFEQGVIGGLVGGTTAGGFSIRNRAQIKNYLREELAGVVPEKDLNAVVNKLYEDGIDTMAGIVTAELSESESLRNKHGDIYRAMMTAIDKAATQAGAFTDEAERAAYVSETAAMFADQVLAEANFRKVAIDEVLKASDIVFEDGGIKFKTETRVFDDAGNVLEQAMYPSNKPDFSSFYDYAQTKPEKKSYYDLSLDDLFLRIPQDVVIHDKNDHSLTEPEWKNVFEGIKNPIEARVSLKPNSYGKISALLKINANGRLYGVSVTIGGQNNYISTAFKTTDAGYIDWVNKKKKGTSDMPAPENPAGPSSVKHGDVITGKSLNEIIGNLRSEVNDALYQEMSSGGVKGSYSPYNRLLKITEKADYSTLPHEFAHFWLSEMENWVNSGLASEDYLKRYDIAMDWLKAEAGKPLSRRAQEQFARGYEQYLLNGNLPESPMNPLYAEYDKWLKAVYNDLNQPSKKPLTTDMVRFFQSMTTGTLPETVLPPVNVDRREKKENGEGTPRPEVAGNDEGGENVGVRDEEKTGSPRFARDDGNVYLPPIATEAKDGKVSAAAERQNRLNKISGLLKEDPQNVFYEPITLEKSAQQAEMLIERDGLDGVRQMIDGEKPMPENVIRTAVLIAYEQEMLKQGNTAEYLRVLRKHTLEQTRRGQEISAERINQDITNPSYWAKQALLERKNALADNIFERIKKEGDSKEKAVDRFVAETAAEYAEKLEQAERSDNLKKADLINPSFDEETDRLFSIYEKGENESAKAEVGKVSDLLVELAKDKLPVDIRGYNHDIDTSAIGHIYKNHGDVEKEAKRGQIAVVKDDYKRIPEIIYNWDYIAFGSKNKRGQDVIVYGKNMPDGSSVYIEEVRTGRKTLTTNTFRKYKTGVNSNSFAARINDNVRGNTGNVQIIANEDVKNNIHSGDVQKIIKELNNKVKSIAGEQLELFQKESVVGKTYDAVYDEIGRWIEECFDVSVSAEEMNVLKEKTDELARAFAAGLKPGENPSVEAMGKIREMRETVAAMNPTNWLSLAVNSYGRAAMLSSPKSAVLNILSNAETYITEAIARRIAAGSFEKAVDPAAVKAYLDYDYEVYKKSGVMMSVVRPEEILDPARRLLGENVMSSAGEGNFRKGVRFMERLIFDWSLGTPDAKSKALSFVDNAALEATKAAKAEGLTGKALTERATALFKDACLYQPVTAQGISIRNSSINAAEVATFTNNGKIAKMSGKVRNLINDATGKARLGDFIMPFVKTPANVVALGMEYSFGLGTAALHLPQILADVRAGTLSEVSRNVIRSSIRNGIGMALAALIASLFDPEDYISSFALASQKERDLVRFKNGVYNSIKIGGKYVSLDYFGPLGAPLVGWFEAKKARGLVEKVAAFAKAAGQQFGNVPGVKELASLTGWIDKAVAQPTEKTLEDLWNGTTDQILARTVPAIVTDIAKIADPFERVSEDGVVGALAAKFPVAREALAAKADMSAGREKESEGALSVLLFGARVKTAADNAVAKEIRRLSDAGEVPQLSDVARSFKGLTDKGKARVRLEFVKGFVNPWGNKVEGYSERVARLIGSEAYRTLSDGRKKEAINKIRQKVMKELKRKYGGG